MKNIKNVLAAPHSVSNKKVIGRIEYLNFPEWDLENIAAKIDTGADSCTIHAEDIKVKRLNKTNWIYFKPLNSNREVKKPIWGKVSVASSNGEKEKRFQIQTKVQLAGEEHKLTFSLTDRSTMEHPILLGLDFLKKFHIDPNQEFIHENFISFLNWEQFIKKIQN